MLRSGAEIGLTPGWIGSKVKRGQNSSRHNSFACNAKPRIRLGYAVVAVLMTLVVAACQGEDPEPVAVENGNPETGAELIQEYGCGECHYIPGIDGADGGDAPGLQLWPNRALVAGIPNTPENTIQFVDNPDEVRPGTPMPDPGVSEQEARHIAAYLFTLN